MSRKSDESDTGTRADAAPDAREEARPAPGGGPRLALLLLEAGGRLCALPAEEAEATAEHLRPTPLPGAPPTVLGVVALRGRVLTALDARALLARTEETEDARVANDAARAASPRVFVALRGDEQLALAAESVERIEIDAGEVRAARGAGGVARGAFTRDGAEVFILEPSRLFETALRGAERRRKR